MKFQEFNYETLITKSRHNVIFIFVLVDYTILKMNKLHMYKTYATLKDYFGDRVRMGYTDTDALILIVESDDLYTKLKSHPQLRDLIDFSSIS